MKRLGWLVFGCLFYQFLPAQNISVKELTGLLDLPQNKLENYFHKKGFKKSGFFALDEDAVYSKTRQENNQDVTRNFQVLSRGKEFELLYGTSSAGEYAALQSEMQATQFYFAPPKITGGPVLYQKQAITVNCFSQPVDTSLFYVLRIGKKNIPKLKDLVFAEDLLLLNSQELLSEAFGRKNIKPDLFYFSHSEKRKCTVIFHNSSRQAIFLWKDEENLRDVSFIIIGEQLNSDNKNVNAVMLSSWKSSQGIYCGMSLQEIEKINKAPVSFYNWRTESPGFLGPKNEGEIDFDKLKPVFNCMNCSFLFVDTTQDIIQSTYALDENQKVYVGSFVVLPEKKNDSNRLTSIK